VKNADRTVKQDASNELVPYDETQKNTYRKKLNNVYSAPDIITLIKSRKIRQARHVALTLRLYMHTKH
jgi:hypothetical protein